MTENGFSSSTLVTVVVATRNYGHYLHDSIGSLAKQTHENWECIIVDDASTDDTPEAIRQWTRKDERIRSIRLNERVGPSAARNRGFVEARGAYLQWLDADDLLEPGKLSLHASCLDRRSEVDVVYGSARYFNGDATHQRLYSKGGLRRTSWIPEVEGSGEAVVNRLLESNIMPINAALVRRSCYAQTPFDERIYSGEDFLSWIMLAVNGAAFSFCDADDARALIRVHSSNASSDRELYVSSLATGARIARSHFPDRTPSLFESALAAEQALGGRRLVASRRFFGAALRATTPFNACKYILFGFGSVSLPRAALLILFTDPLPEWFERFRGK